MYPEFERLTTVQLGHKGLPTELLASRNGRQARSHEEYSIVKDGAVTLRGPNSLCHCALVAYFSLALTLGTI
jgi:hypothetical protein